MGRWGVVAGCVLLAACGGSSGGRLNREPVDASTPSPDAGQPGGTGDAGPSAGGDAGSPGGAGDGGLAADGGVVACSVPASGTCPLTPLSATPVTFSTAVDGGTCWATGPADGMGNLLVERFESDGDSGGPYATVVVRLYDPSGGLLGRTRPLVQGGGALPLASGWLVTRGLGNPLRVGYGYAGLQLYRLSSSLDGGTDPAVQTDMFTGNGVISSAPLGGAAAVGGTPPPEIDGGVGYGTEVFRVTRFDASGAAVESADLGRFDTEEFSPRVGVNRAGDVLVLAGTHGWTLDASGALTSFTYPPGSPDGIFPLADGRFAVRGGDGPRWQATVSPSGTVEPAPCWLTVRPDVESFQLVRGGESYAVFHGPITGTSCERYLEVVHRDGTSCGFVPSTGPETCNPFTVAIGLDGTLTTLDSRTCTTRAWRGAFGQP